MMYTVDEFFGSLNTSFPKKMIKSPMTYNKKQPTKGETI